MRLGLSGPSHRRDVVSCRSSLDDGSNALTPGIQGGPLLIRPFVALVEANNPGAAPGNMVENCLSYLKPDTEFLEAGGDSAAQIVERPTGHAAPLIEARL
jgi:hypothetical protein